MKAVVEVKNLTYTYPGRRKPSLSRVSFSLSRGEFVLVCGETGCGKSTLLSCLNGLIPHESGGRLKGEVRLFGKPGPLRPQEAFPRVFTVFQNPASQLISDTVKGEVSFALENLGLPTEVIEERVKKALTFVGLADKAEASLRMLSGGQRQRVAIAAALAVRPDLLLLDEPLSQLDPQGVKEVLSVLRRLSATGLTIVLVEHRLREALPLVERVIFLERGQVRYDGPPEGFPFEPSFPAGLSLPPPKNQVVLRVEDLGFSYPGGEELFFGINLAFLRGERVALVGENGTGKSTFLALLAGLLKPTRGRIKYLLPKEAGRLRTTLLLQDPDLMLFRPSLKEELSFAPRMLGLQKAEIEERAKEVAQKLSLETYLGDPPFSLSRGERLRAALASLLTGSPQVLLLDEPTTAQDREHVRAVLSSLSAELVIFSTHDEEAARLFAHRLVRFPLRGFGGRL